MSCCRNVLLPKCPVTVTPEALRAKVDWKSVIWLQRGQFDPKFHVEGVTPTNHSFSQKTRLNGLSYGIKIFSDFSSILSQFTRLTDRRTDGRTDRQTDRILIARSRLNFMQSGKNLIRKLNENTYRQMSVEVAWNRRLKHDSSWFSTASSEHRGLFLTSAVQHVCNHRNETLNITELTTNAEFIFYMQCVKCKSETRELCQLFGIHSFKKLPYYQYWTNGLSYKKKTCSDSTAVRTFSWPTNVVC